MGHLAGRCNPRGLQGLFGRGWADLAGYSRGGGGAVGVVGGGPPPCRNFVLAPKESTYACSTTGLGRGLGLLPRAGAGLWGVLCSAEAGQLAFPQTALHHPSVELYRGGPCTGLPLDPAPQPASVLRAPRLRSHLGMRPWRCFGRGGGNASLGEGRRACGGTPRPARRHAPGALGQDLRGPPGPRGGTQPATASEY